MPGPRVLWRKCPKSLQSSSPALPHLSLSTYNHCLLNYDSHIGNTNLEMKLSGKAGNQPRNREHSQETGLQPETIGRGAEYYF